MQPETVLKELRDLWVSLGKAEGAPGGVIRACAMTLIVAAEKEPGPELGETLARLMPDHPSRLMVIRAGKPGELSARVFAQCWMPCGRRQQICCEQIEITAGPDRLDDAARGCLPLIAPDLPVAVWCRGAPRPLGGLASLADKIIFDTRSATGVSPAIDLIRGLRQSSRRIADLAWTRLTGLRAQVAGIYEEHGYRVVEEAIVEAPPAESLYLTAWLERGFPNARIQAARATTGLKVTLCGPEFEASAEDPGQASELDLMREELSIAGEDRIYDQVLQLIVQHIAR